MRVWRWPLLLLLMNIVAPCPAQDVPDASRDPVVLAVRKVVPAVVNIKTERLVARQFSDPFEEMFREFFNYPRRRGYERGQSLGSGVIVDEDGWIVTNYHVITRASKITVVLAGGSEYDARFVSGDDRNDLALLKIEANKPLPFVEIAGDDEPMLGETVVAVGNPFGLDHTVTKGIISAKNRPFETGGQVFDDVLQTDAAINPGNSGGPLINLRGQLVGINMAILSYAQNIGFAIPAKRVTGMLVGWFSPEKRARLWLGLQFIREDGKIVVADVQDGSPAAKAGFAARDRVLTVDDSKFEDVMSLQRHLLHKKAGDTVKFDVERGGQRRNLDVKLTALPKLSATDLILSKFGVRIQELTPDLARALGVVGAQGVVVSDVQRDSPAAEVGFRGGMIITQVGGEDINSMEQLAEQLVSIRSGDEVKLTVFISEQHGNITRQRITVVTLTAR